MELDESQQLHGGVLNAIARLTDRHHRKERHTLMLSEAEVGTYGPVDRYSLQHLVTFLDNGDSHEVTELVLEGVELVSDPSPDGGLDVLRNFFARSDTTLTKVTLSCCHFGSQEDTSQLLAAFQTNRSVLDLAIIRIRSLHGAALGNSLSSLLQNMPQLRRLDCHCSRLRVEGIQALQPGLRSNRTLKELDLSACELGDEGIRLVADALVGNTIMEALDITFNSITAVGLDDITRLLESSRLKKLNLKSNNMVFGDSITTRRFACDHIKTRVIKGLGYF
jgi:Leucine Rich repeat